MTAIGGPPWRHGTDIDWRPAAATDESCTAWIADEWASAACTLHGAHELHEGPHDERPDQVASWHDDDAGARTGVVVRAAEVAS